MSSNGAASVGLGVFGSDTKSGSIVGKKKRIDGDITGAGATVAFDFRKVPTNEQMRRVNEQYAAGNPFVKAGLLTT